MRVRCEPLGRAVVVAEGESLFAALRRQRVPIAFTCDAEGICGRCVVQVVGGRFTPPGELERATATQQGVDGRLACLCRPVEDAVVTTTYW